MPAIIVVILLLACFVLAANQNVGYLVPKAYGSGTVIQVSPANTTGNVGQQIAINTTVTDVTNMTGWEFKLFYLNSILNCTSFTEGPFLKQAGTTFTVIDILNNYNSTHGRVLAACALLGMGTSESGSGVLATFTFNPTAPGQTNITLQDTKLSDDKIPPQPIPHTVTHGTVSITAPFEQVLDVYTQRGGYGINVSSDAFAPGETVFFNASLKYQNTPVPGVIVQFTIFDPNGLPTAGTAVTGQDGIATISTTISSTPTFGNYTTLAKANTHGEDFNDSVTYRVGWIVWLQDMKLCDYSGTPLNSSDRGTKVYVNVTLENISFNPKTLFLWVHAWDYNAADVAREYMLFTVPSGKTTVLLGFRIPQWSARQEGAQLYVGAYNNPYWAGGSAYCPGMYSSLTITGS